MHEPCTRGARPPARAGGAREHHCPQATGPRPAPPRAGRRRPHLDSPRDPCRSPAVPARRARPWLSRGPQAFTKRRRDDIGPGPGRRAPASARGGPAGAALKCAIGTGAAPPPATWRGPLSGALTHLLLLNPSATALATAPKARAPASPGSRRPGLSRSPRDPTPRYRRDTPDPTPRHRRDTPDRAGAREPHTRRATPAAAPQPPRSRSQRAACSRARPFPARAAAARAAAAPGRPRRGNCRVGVRRRAAAGPRLYVHCVCQDAAAAPGRGAARAARGGQGARAPVRPRGRGARPPGAAARPAPPCAAPPFPGAFDCCNRRDTYALMPGSRKKRSPTPCRGATEPPPRRARASTRLLMGPCRRCLGP
jgi:hypothetical protein